MCRFEESEYVLEFQIHSYICPSPSLTRSTDKTPPCEVDETSPITVAYHFPPSIEETIQLELI